MHPDDHELNAAMATAEGKVGALPIWLLPLLKGLSPMAVRPLLGAIAKGSSVDAVKTEAKTWIANNGG